MLKIVPELSSDEIRKLRTPRKRERQRVSDVAPGRDARKGPGPSKLSYRVSRAWAKPMVRNAVLVYVPLLVLGLVGWRIAADDGIRTAVEGKITAVIDDVAARPEFAVRGVAVTGGSNNLRAEVLQTVNVAPGTSSLKLDVEDLRLRVEALGAVKRATVQFDPQGMLRVNVTERVPAVLFRRADMELVLMDAGGVEIGPAGPRADHPNLPVVVGDGAPDRVGEVLDLLAAAPEIVPRLRAVIRVGERRWDMVLDRGLTIMMPEEGGAQAMSRIMALHYGEELLDRDLAVIDMRLPGRPALRMKPEAAEAYQIRKAVAALGGEDT